MRLQLEPEQSLLKKNLFVVLVTILLHGAVDAHGDSPHLKPNILLIMTDQQAATAMSCTGNADLTTPAIDRLAAAGVVFNRAYFRQLLCLPCRSSLQTAHYPHEIGTTSNATKINGDFPLLGNLANTAGYECAYFANGMSALCWTPWDMPNQLDQNVTSPFDDQGMGKKDGRITISLPQINTLKKN